MREGPDVLINAAAGERLVVRRRPPEPGGRLEMTLELATLGGGAPPHAHPLQTERFHVRRGALSLTIEDERRLLRAGDEAVVEPGQVHRWEVVEPGTEVALEVEPALRFEAVLERAFALVDSGAIGPGGVADEAAVAAFEAEFAGEYRLVGA